MYAIKAMGYLRVSTAGELTGLDLHEHGIPAYPEYVLVTSAAPHGTPEFTSKAFGPERSPAHRAREVATARS
jgi:Amt family ammonium transporter